MNFEDSSVQEPAGFVGTKFCRECNNMLYPKEDKKERRLLYSCRNCDHQEYAENPCIYVNKITHEVDELTQIVSDVISDPTLPRTSEHPCPRCHRTPAVFFQAHSRQSDDKMTLYYVWWSFVFFDHPSEGNYQISLQISQYLFLNRYICIFKDMRADVQFRLLWHPPPP